MKKIWKYMFTLDTLRPDSSVSVLTPHGARPMAAAFTYPDTDASVEVWFEFSALFGVPERVNQTLMKIYVFGTGHPIPDGLEYFATIKGRQFVWHFYREPRA